MSGYINQTINLLLLLFGFGFVIFFHELGHFLAAKWAGVRVEQFAVGFGQALFSWRKGLGFRPGSSAKEYEQMVAAAKEGVQKRDMSHISETEYRLNWIPLGGYVKMLGQDDLNPNAASDDPHAFNRKSIGKRMVIVSAGVIMNVILAAIGFFVLFLIGFDVPPPVVGSVMPNSPAQKAGVHVGDRILTFDGKVQRDFTKITLNVALVHEGDAVPMQVRHPDGQEETLSITPERSDRDLGGFLALGIGQSPQLNGLDPRKDVIKELAETKDLQPPDVDAVHPGETIVAVAGQRIDSHDPKQLHEYWRLDQAVQQSNGKPVPITVSDGKTERQEEVVPRFQPPFKGAIEFAGLCPRAIIGGIDPSSATRGKLKPGDVVESVTVGTDTKPHPSQEELLKILRAAGDAKAKVSLGVLRDGQHVDVKDLETVSIGDGRRGLGIQLESDADHAVIASVLPKSSADSAKLTLGDSSDVTVVRIGDETVNSFHDIKRILSSAKPGKVTLVIKSDAGEQPFPLTLTEEDIQQAKNLTYGVDALLHPLSEPRKTRNFLTAGQWGIEETRDLIVQFYITLQRMFGGSVSAKSMMGPLGIGKAGLSFAEKGMDWLIWFLAMISANLAVVNFLPIPIVDGGLFLFLIIEKFQGRPLSAKVQSIAQIVGIALIASVFIFVTYQDIMRH